ncbi:hypothetical protein V497_07668 [Pseudogymnoascus sp. VKM F-4516 (FW-969)]|nr:hypothetical protein V497_07668 [Pseudogymnoascus sp. VKM F-4516 (FW-969)]
MKTCSADEGKFFKVSPGVAVKIIPRSSTTTQSSTEASSPTSSLPSSSPSTRPTLSSSDPPETTPTCVATNDKTECPVFSETEKTHSANTVAAVGAGVGVPLVVLALTLLGLFLNERRLRKQLTKPSDVSAAGAGAGAAYGPMNNTYQGEHYSQGPNQEQVQYVYKPENEMSASPDPAHEMTGGQHRPVHELGSQNYPP